MMMTDEDRKEAIKQVALDLAHSLIRSGKIVASETIMLSFELAEEFVRRCKALDENSP
jgi:hypothetical protein